jgi:hypothetical protein
MNAGGLRMRLVHDQPLGQLHHGIDQFLCCPSWTISRRAAVQRWPADRKADWAISVAAVNASGMSQTTSGLLPPSSSARIFSGVLANCGAATGRHGPSR